MIKKYPLLFLAVLGIAIGVVAYFVGPVMALADGEIPPVEETPAPETQPVQETSSVQETQPEQPILPQDTAPIVAETPAEEPITADVEPTGEASTAPEEDIPTDTGEELPGEEPALEETPLEATPVDADLAATPAAPDDTETPVYEEDRAVETVEEEQTPTDEAVAAQPIIDVLPTVEENTPEGETADTAMETAIEEPVVDETYSGLDPYIDRLDGRYRFLSIGGCAAYGGVGTYCSESTTPLQEAIDGAYDGEVINVEAGTYTEQVQILNISLTLRGWGSPVISAPGTLAATGSAFALIYASNATLNIEGFVIDASTASDGEAITSSSIYAIYYHNAAGVIANNTIISNAATDDQTSAMMIDNADGAARSVTVTNNTVINYTQSGVTAQGSNLDSTITYNHFNNTAAPTADSAAIYVEGSSGNTISANTITGSHAQGIEIKDSDNNIVSYNYISGVSRNGISLINSNGNRVTLNIISRVDDSAGSSAIRIDQDSDNNLIAKNTLQNNSIAVLVLNGSDNAAITENRISNNDVGVQVAADTGYNEPQNTAIYWNIFSGNTSGIVNLTSSTLYAALNWWGCPQGPTTCGSTSGTVITSNPLPYNPDPDYDMVFSPHDNCPYVYNPDQRDTDRNSTGDACEEEIRTYKILSVNKEADLQSYSFMLDKDWATELVLIDLQQNQEEVELARVFYAPEAAPDPMLVSFTQVLEDTLPKPLEADVLFLGAGFELRAADAHGARLETLSGEMELRWNLPENYSIPDGYRFAVYTFDTDTLFWISETWKPIPSEYIEDENVIFVQTDWQGAFVLVLEPEP